VNGRAFGDRRGMMERAVYAAIVIATVVSVARTGWVLLGFLRTLARPRASVDIKWDWALFLVAPEVALPAIAALWLLFNHEVSPPYPVARLLCPLLGASLALGGLALTIWSWLSLPSVGTGHYLLEGQSLVTTGAYGFVRNPIYTGAFLIWFGLAAAYTSGAVLLLTVLYVIPVYILNVRGEEQMMLTRYGDEYRAYRRRVGAFIPALRKGVGSASGRPTGGR
jgi:protein-S-isoprenylcysteine O-methyltransferase Ste14